MSGEHAEMADLFTIGNPFFRRQYARGCTCGWRTKFRDHTYQADDELRRHLNPGLHRTGPNPWDFEFNPAKGMKVAFVDVDGRRFDGTISDFQENAETGELTMTVDQFPDALEYLPLEQQ